MLARETVALTAQVGVGVVGLWILICEGVGVFPSGLRFLGAGEEKVGDWAFPDG